MLESALLCVVASLNNFFLLNPQIEQKKTETSKAC